MSECKVVGILQPLLHLRLVLPVEKISKRTMNYSFAADISFRYTIQFPFEYNYSFINSRLADDSWMGLAVEIELENISIAFKFVVTHLQSLFPEIHFNFTPTTSSFPCKLIISSTSKILHRSENVCPGNIISFTATLLFPRMSDLIRPYLVTRHMGLNRG